jgi:hypothetical protein
MTTLTEGDKTMGELRFFNPYLRCFAQASAIDEDKYLLRHDEDRCEDRFLIGFTATTMLVGTPAHLLHPALPEGRAVKSLSYDVYSTDPNGYEHTGWILSLEQSKSSIENQNHEAVIRSTAEVV